MKRQLPRIILALSLAITGVSFAHGQSLSGKAGSAIQNFGSQAAIHFGGQYSNGNLQNQWQGAIEGTGQQNQNHWNGGNGNQWPPQWTNPPITWPTPQPCHHYKVYYYCQTRGWQPYGTYHSNASADYAVTSLQQQGYRAYKQRLQR